MLVIIMYVRIVIKYPLYDKELWNNLQKFTFQYAVYDVNYVNTFMITLSEICKTKVGQVNILHERQPTYCYVHS